MTALRPMVAADAPIVADLATQLGYPSSPDEVATRFEELHRRDDDEVLVATDAEDTPIGWVHVARVAALESGPMALIGGLVVDDAHRSSGVGGELLAGQVVELRRLANGFEQRQGMWPPESSDESI